MRVITGSDDLTVDAAAATLLAGQFDLKPIMIRDAGHDPALEPQLITAPDTSANGQA